MNISSSSSNSSSGVVVPHDSFEIFESESAAALLAVDLFITISGILNGVDDRDLLDMVIMETPVELATCMNVLRIVCIFDYV